MKDLKNEQNYIRNMLKFLDDYPLVAIVGDTYDIYNFVDLLGDMKDEVIKATEGGKFVVVRPDSGDPRKVPVEVVKRLDAAFGSTVNTKGYRVLNHVRVIQGDGVNLDSIRDIMDSLIEAGYSVSNIAFGMGGALLQQPNRDTLSFAMKCSAVCVNGEWRDVFKDPITDSGKKSKKGRLALILKDGEYETIREDEMTGHMLHPGVNRLETVFENGAATFQTDWQEVVARAK